MDIHLAYGKKGLVLTTRPGWDVQVIQPRYTPGAPDPAALLRTALRQPYQSAPLSDLARQAQKVGIVVNDITRASPNESMLSAIWSELAGLPDEKIQLYVALGSHRQMTAAELSASLGTEAVRRFRIVQNNAFDPQTQVCLGTTPAGLFGRSGNEIWLNRELAQCDLKILTGFIEPHFFAGFSGGGKALVPGMAGMKTILHNHSWQHIAHPDATWGITQGNPLWEEIHQAADLCGQLFLCNVTLNREKEITGVYAGDLRAAHSAGCQSVKAAAMVPVDGAFDVVVTTNSGYPLDQNLYQSVKGMSAAAQIVKPGGAIIMAAECADGIPEHGLYAQLLRSSRNPAEILQQMQSFGQTRQDQWQVQIQASILEKARICLYSENLSPDQVRDALLIPVTSIEAALDDLVRVGGAGTRICVMPEGPLTIPYLDRVHRPLNSAAELGT